MSQAISRAGAWLLDSGIQEPNGGVARYYRVDRQRNHPVSTEITGYAISAFVYLHAVTGDSRYLDRATTGARFLVQCLTAGSMPFEIDPPRFTYFFDCGIIVRGLLAVWRATGEAGLLEAAAAIGRSMAQDFAAAGDFHPVLSLPDKNPTPRDPLRWSQSPGCYQLKAAMAWADLAEAAGDAKLREPYERLLDFSLRSYGSFLPGHPERIKVMDRLHAFLYFLEGLLPCAHQTRCAAALCDGIRRAAQLLREIAPEFERSDVYAQLLRMRLLADRAGAAPLDREAARWEAGRLAEFQAASSDPRLNGGFYFGRHGSAPHGGAQLGGAEYGGEEHGGVQHGGAEYGGEEHGGAQHGGAEHGGEEHGGAQDGSAQHGSAEHGGAGHGGALHGGAPVGGAQHGGVRHGNAQHGGAQHGSAEHGGALHGGAQLGAQVGGAWLPYVNPVSTVFALQALAMWDGADPHVLI